MKMQTDVGDLIKDRRVQIIAGSILLLIILGIVLFNVLGNRASNDAATLPPPGSGTVPQGTSGPGMPSGGASGGPIAAASGGPIGAMPSGGAPGVPLAAGSGAPAMGIPGSGPAMNPPGAGKGQMAATSANARPVPNSFADEPVGYGGGAGGATAPGGLGAPGMGSPGGMGAAGPSMGMGGMPGGGAAGGGGAGSSGPKPAPIAANRVAQGARQDPFVPFYHFLIMQPPAYSMLAAVRLASRPTPPPLPPIIDPDLRFGPLPAVERRVAGILFDGSVSAILETGTPGGAGTDVRVIQPGATVPSGVPNLEDLTVASITPTQVVLRAQDGRTTTVKLSNVPAAYADSFRSATSGPPGGQPGGGTPGGGGPPGGPGFPGGGRGGKGGAAVGGALVN